MTRAYVLVGKILEAMSWSDTREKRQKGKEMERKREREGEKEIEENTP